jgi:hypothetical protein
MAEQAYYIVEISEHFGIDYRLIPAISIVESSGGKYCFKSYNPFGWGKSGFWMKNCEMPLDIIFIDSEGVIIDIKEDFEPCRQDPCPSYIPDYAYKYALEVNGGWVEENGVEIGDEIEEL